MTTKVILPNERGENHHLQQRFPLYESLLPSLASPPQYLAPPPSDSMERCMDEMKRWRYVHNSCLPNELRQASFQSDVTSLGMLHYCLTCYWTAWHDGDNGCCVILQLSAQCFRNISLCLQMSKIAHFSVGYARCYRFYLCFTATH